MLEVSDSNSIKSPFGYDSHLLKAISVTDLNDMYIDKCNVDIKKYLPNIEFIQLYKCEGTGYKFWYPFNLAGNEDFYNEVSKVWDNYYQEWRWEYRYALDFVDKNSNCLEIGCGKGFFLRELEKKQLSSAVGIDFNLNAIENKVTKFDIFNENIENLLNDKKFEVVFLFQVLEHLVDPCNILMKIKKILATNGFLIFSVPNNDYSTHRLMLDAFDLPPHHLGHYNEVVINKIAENLDMEVVKFVKQKIGFDSRELKLKYRNYYKFMKYFLYLKSFFIKNDGHTILAVLRVKSYE